MAREPRPSPLPQALAASLLAPLAHAPLAHAQILTENFDAFPPPGWAVINRSAPPATPPAPAWSPGLAAVHTAHTLPPAAYALTTWTVGSPQGAAVSAWLLTPTLPLATGDTLSFWLIGQSQTLTPDRLQVRLSTAGPSADVGLTVTSVGDFTTLLLDVNPTYARNLFPTTWRRYTVTLPALPPGAQGRLAFRYFLTDNQLQGTVVGLDTLRLDPAAPPCYPNCDDSTTFPAVNAIDFMCFLERYQSAITLPAGEQITAYPNCDASTTFPAVNAVDFSCFLTRYRAGCV